MSAPTKEKTWTKYSTFVTSGTGPTPQSGQSQDNSDGRLVFYLLKSQFLAAGWEVVSSCGYYSSAWHVGEDDHWIDAASVRWKEADNKFGWIVLKNTLLHSGGEGFQICIALTALASSGYSSNTITLAFACEGGFTGGSTTARPTATDEVVIFNNEVATGYVYSTFTDNALNIWYSSDGEAFRLWWGNGISNLILDVNPPWIFEKIQNAPIWLDKPVMAGVMRWDAEGSFLKDGGSYTPKRFYFCCDEFTKCPLMFSAEGTHSGGVLSKQTSCQLADLGGNWPVFPISVVSVSPLVNGCLGTVADMWLVPTALAFGDYMPGDGSKEFVVMHDLLLANDGTSVIIP